MTERKPIHTGLAAGRWQTFSLAEQLANVGSEVSRAVRAKEQGNSERMWSALERALELLDLTSDDPRHTGPPRRELRRVREVVCDFFVGNNEYHSTPESLMTYFL